MGKKLKSSTARSMAESFISDKKNANNLVELIGFLENEEDIPACLVGLHIIFNYLIDKEIMCTNKIERNDISTVNKKYSKWLKEMYADTQCKLVELMLHESTNIQELSLSTLMKFVKAEGQKPLKVTTNPVSFPTGLFGHIIKQMLSYDRDMSSLLGRFQEFMEFDDVRYNAMKITLKHLQNEVEIQDDTVYLNNVFCLIDTLSMPTQTPEDDLLTNFLSEYPQNPKGLVINSFAEQKQLFSQLWLLFLERKLPTSLYKKVLIMLHEKVIPHMENPLLLSDFLTTSYNIGGAISLLALNGLFILVNQYNLDYPDFYQKLYELLEPSVFHVKYKARFFYLTDLFLTSTHLPAYLIAAFIKRLARLTLVAPPSGLTIIVPFIYNLLVRHPSCKTLMHCTNSAQLTEEISTDPFNNDEPDLAKCNALESSLWELNALESHYLHTISGEAKKSQQPLPRMESDLSELLETTIESLMTQENQTKLKQVSTTFESPSGLFGNKEDELKDYWTWTAF